MAFMMPVMKNNYEIYPAKSKAKRSSSGSGTHSNRSSRPASRNVSESDKGNNVDNLLLSPSPPNVIYSSSAPSQSMLTAAAAVRPGQRTVRFCRSISQDRAAVIRRRSTVSRASTSSSQSTGSTASCSDNVSTTGSNSNVEASSPKFGSLTKFHCKLVDSLRRKLRIKDDNEDDATVIRAST